MEGMGRVNTNPVNPVYPLRKPAAGGLDGEASIGVV